jgi:hypothetical protein
MMPGMPVCRMVAQRRRLVRGFAFAKRSSRSRDFDSPRQPWRGRKTNAKLLSSNVGAATDASIDRLSASGERQALLVQMIPFVIFSLAFAGGYGLRSFVSYQRRQRWDGGRRRPPRIRL